MNTATTRLGKRELVGGWANASQARWFEGGGEVGEGKGRQQRVAICLDWTIQVIIFTYGATKDKLTKIS